MPNTAYTETPLGALKITEDNGQIVSMTFSDQPVSSEMTPVLKTAVEQVQAYFEGTIRNFDLPLAAEGTAFQESVWKRVGEIPFGHTRSYIDIARQLGDPNKVRAVGTANGANPILLVVPCHRVLGSNGDLVGYAGELWRKQWLLQHEQNLLSGQTTLF